jgi:hypothetical protein
MGARMLVECKESDRNIVLFFDDKGILDGVNFWQGIGELSIADSYLSSSDSDISKYISEIGKVNTLDCMSSAVIFSIDDGIWEYLDAKNNTTNVEVLSYVEDGKLVLAVRSLRPFEGSDFDGEFYYKYFEDGDKDLYISQSIAMNK